MRFFMVYSNQFAVGNKPIGIASLAAVARRAGHQFTLFDCTAYDIRVENKLDWNLAGVKNVEYKLPSNPERMPKRRDVTFNEMVTDLLAAIDGFLPDIIGLSALTDDYPLGVGLMRLVRRHFPKIPIICGGVHATVDPAGVINQDCFDIVCVGEGEYVMLDIGRHIDAGLPLDDIANLWVKRPDGTVKRNPVRPYEQKLDLFPYPDWSIYCESAFFKPFHGYIYRYGDFEMSRGCPYKCSYCINVQLQEIYAPTGGNYHREKSIPRVMSEIEDAIERYGIEFLKFWDETFLLMSRERMEEFCDLYSTRIKLPYVIETTAQSITPHSARILQKTNCRSASLGMETGSVDMRKGMLHKPTGNDVYVRAFMLMEEHGVGKVSFNMIGLPNESQIDIFRTIAMNRLVKTDNQSVGIFYPYKGTPIRDMMVREGWMGADFEYENLQDYDFNTFTAGNRSTVRFKDMDSRLLNRLWMLFSSYTFWPVDLWPLIDYVKNNDDQLAVDIRNNAQAVTYFKKFGEFPPWVELDRPEPADLPRFADAETADFARLLVQHWAGGPIERVREMLVQIAAGRLLPDVPIPKTGEDLADWLELNKSAEKDLRRVRQDLREMAKVASQAYV